MQKNYFIAFTLDLLRVDSPWSGTAPAPLDTTESLMGNVGFSTCWGGAGLKILV